MLGSCGYKKATVVLRCHFRATIIYSFSLPKNISLMASLPGRDEGIHFLREPDLSGARKPTSQLLTCVSAITHEIPEPQTRDSGMWSVSSCFLHFFPRLCTLFRADIYSSYQPATCQHFVKNIVLSIAVSTVPYWF